MNNDNKEQNLNNNMLSDYKRYIRKQGAKSYFEKAGSLCAIITIILVILAFVNIFIGDSAILSTTLIIIATVPFTLCMSFSGLISSNNETINVFVRKNNQIYYINAETLRKSTDIGPYIMAQTISGNDLITLIVGIFTISSFKKNNDEFHELLSKKSFDDPFFLNDTSHIQSVEIIKETPSYLKINARFENQGRKTIIISNIYEDYNELINSIKALGGNK